MFASDGQGVVQKNRLYAIWYLDINFVIDWKSG